MSNEIVSQIWYKNFGCYPERYHRLETGNCHYVYGVMHNKTRYILRIASKDNLGFLKASLYWIKLMEPLKIPIPRVLIDGTNYEYPYVIMSYFEGKDLGDVYSCLSDEQKKKIVRQLVSVQSKVEQLPIGNGFGYLASYDDPDKKATWKEVIICHLERSKSRMKNNGIFDWRMVEEVKHLLDQFDSYFDDIAPTPFLDDITTKNVIIQKGELSGIVDLDWMCFGDKLYVLALTQMALISMGYDTRYIDYWKEEIRVTQEQERILALYTLVFCLDFMSEKGMTFNKTEPIGVTCEEVKTYETWYRDMKKDLMNG